MLLQPRVGQKHLTKIQRKRWMGVHKLLSIVFITACQFCLHEGGHKKVEQNARLRYHLTTSFSMKRLPLTFPGFTAAASSRVFSCLSAGLGLKKQASSEKNGQSWWWKKNKPIGWQPGRERLMHFYCHLLVCVNTAKIAVLLSLLNIMLSYFLRRAWREYNEVWLGLEPRRETENQGHLMVLQSNTNTQNYTHSWRHTYSCMQNSLWIKNSTLGLFSETPTMQEVLIFM